MQESENWKKTFELAQHAALRGQFDTFIKYCQKTIELAGNDIDGLVSVGVLLLSFGYVSPARQCFAHVLSIAPADMRAVLNLANLAQQVGDHAETRRLYALVLEHLPNHPVVRRNALVSLEYDPVVSDCERLAAASAWGDWAVTRAGDAYGRPPLPALDAQTLRVGYVSADFCQHTVGLFVKDVLAAHDRSRMKVYAYSAGNVDDWVTAEVRQASLFRDVRNLDDAALVALVRQDEIDILVDLSGHTAGSRLTAFARRPAPVQVSWLGYFATTGLKSIDAVLLDDWHAPVGTEAQFVEPIVRLPTGRFCYTPVPFAPKEVTPPPYIVNGHVTFGSFNNTAKLNSGVFNVWASILSQVPDSHLVLKWRTFQDEGMRASVLDEFAKRGIEADRIELRGASFHADLLKEYADIDVCLDPFPFTGGLTSCEALWMGVPVVTCPESRVVSRQTYAFLSAIGLGELAGKDKEDYVRIAVELARDKGRLQILREGMRQRMLASPLCDVRGFTRQLEETLFALAENRNKRTPTLFT